MGMTHLKSAISLSHASNGEDIRSQNERDNIRRLLYVDIKQSSLYDSGHCIENWEIYGFARCILYLEANER